MALFPRCNNPVPVVGRHGLTLVGCHSCIQCRVAAQEHLCKILEVEASKHKFVEFLTNTHSQTGTYKKYLYTEGVHRHT